MPETATSVLPKPLRPLDPRLLRVVPALRRQLLVLAPLLVVRTSCTVAGAVLLARLLTRLMGDASTGLGSTVLLLVVVLAVRAGADGLVELVGERGRHRVRAELRQAALAGLLVAGPRPVDGNDPTRSAHALGPGLDALDGYVTRVLPALVGAVVTPPLVLLAIGLADGLSVLLLLLVLPLVPLFLALVGMATRDRTQQAYATLGVLAARLLDLLQGLPTLKIHGRAQGQVAAVGRVTERYRAQTVRALRWGFLSGLTLDLIATLSVALVAVNIGLRLDGGSVGLGAALVVLLLAPEVFTPLRAVGAQFHASTDALEAAATALGHAAAPVAVERGTLHDAEPVASLVAVTVRHPGRPRAALREVSLTLAPGEVVALEGTSGSGKSTLLDVLLGAVVPSEGTVVTADAGAAWRDRLAWAPQRPRPHRATVGTQVLLGDPTASPGQVDAALRECDALPAATLLGEGGRAVSAGQRRRVALAQALLRARAVAARGQVPLVLLDEPSEDLDAAGEAVVARVVDGLRGIAAVVLVTHSPRLAALADRRLRMTEGRLVVDLQQQPERGDVAPPLGHPGSPVVAQAVPALAVGQPALAAGQGEGLRQTLGTDVRGLGPSVVLALGLSAAAAVSAIVLAACSAWLVLRASQQPGVQALGLAVVGVRTFALAKAMLRYAERLVGHDLALKVLTRTRMRVVAALVPLAPTGLGLWRRGDVLRRFSADVDAVQDALVRGLLPLAGALASAVAALTLTWFVAPAAVPALALVLAASVVVLLLAGAAGRRGAERAGTLAGESDEAIVGWVEALPELWAYGAAADGLEEIGRREAAAARAARPAGRAAAVATAAAAAAAALAPVAVLAAAAGTASGLAVGVVTLVAVTAVEPVAGLAPAWASLGTAARRARRVGALLSTPPPVPEPVCPVAPPARGAGLSFSEVDLGYDMPLLTGVGVPVMTGVSLEVEPGSRVAVVGPSGCGKSTLLLAALRLLAPSEGTISLTSGVGPSGEQVSLSDVAADDLPPVVSGCLQDDHVFAANLRENLRIGCTTATDADLDAVAERVGLLDWVRTLPDGWSTLAGVDGDRLSGGQRQRLLLARALLADPQVLVLDEPTAHLDPDTERLVMADLLQATRGRTLLLSTHRLAGLAELDAVVRVGDREPHPSV